VKHKSRAEKGKRRASVRAEFITSRKRHIVKALLYGVGWPRLSETPYKRKLFGEWRK
jgi:hypothetical protein